MRDYRVLQGLIPLLCLSNVMAKLNPMGPADKDFVSAGSLNATFEWGTGSASYHFEGAWNASGKSPSIWDQWTHREYIEGEADADKAVDSYNLWQKDVELLNTMGVDAYRFSISWSRVVPKGRAGTEINQQGLKYYANLARALKRNNITVHVTLFHWDLPQVLQDAYDGVLHKDHFKDDFVYYARAVFKEMVPYVDYWTTFNDPRTMCNLGYGLGVHPPGRCSDRDKCEFGDSSIEPWICAHTVLVTHGWTAFEFHKEFPTAPGKISMAIVSEWAVPFSEEDADAANRYLDFTTGLFARPLYKGDWPKSMKQLLGDRLPSFTPLERQLIQGSSDYYAMSHWTSHYIKDRTGAIEPGDTNGNVEVVDEGPDNEPIGPKSGATWMRIVPWGLRNVLNYVHKKYHHPEIHILENGIAVPGEDEMDKEDVLKDKYRSKYLKRYIREMAKAVKRDGVNVKTYLIWALMDNVDWTEGFKVRFGLATRKRVPKQSAHLIRDYFDHLRAQTTESD